MQPRTARDGFDPAPHRAALCAIIDAVLRDPALDAKQLDRILRRHPKPRGMFSKSEIIAGFRAFAGDADEAELVARLQRSGGRSVLDEVDVDRLT